MTSRESERYLGGRHDKPKAFAIKAFEMHRPTALRSSHEDLCIGPNLLTSTSLSEPLEMEQMSSHAPQIHRITARTRHDCQPADQCSPLELPRRGSSKGDRVFQEVEKVLEGDLQGCESVSARMIVECELELF